MKLLTLANAKTPKGEQYGWLTGVLYLAPADLSGFNVCPFAETAGCKNPCLNLSGRAAVAPNKATFTAPNGAVIPDNPIQRARIARTRLYFEDRDTFMEQLVLEIAQLVAKAKRKGLRPAVRLNGTSDIAWERVYTKVSIETMEKLRELAPDVVRESPCLAVNMQGTYYTYQNVMSLFPGVQFYDYTKQGLRFLRAQGLPENYHLTLSWSGATAEYRDLIQTVTSKRTRTNVAVVFRGDLPETFSGRRVIDGDAHDLRFLDPEGVVVGLKAKGRAKHDTTGFVAD